MIGAGALARARGAITRRLDHPEPFAAGDPMGQHLTVERLVRVTEGRQHYLVNNVSRKWPRRKCWACGYKYSPEMSRSCAYCATPLEDLRFLMTRRWSPTSFKAYEEFLKLRVRHFGLIAPVYAFYHGDTMMSVYHYNGESYLVDVPAPLAGSYLLAIGMRVANTLAYLHTRGVILAGLRKHQIAVMPNGSVRLFDLDIAGIDTRRGAVFHHPDNPVERDTRDIGRILLELCSPSDDELANFFRDVTRGVYPTPHDFAEAAEQLHTARQQGNPDASRAGTASAISDVGITRAANEDSMGWRKVGDNATVYAVADGLGGHQHGAVASSLAVDVFTEYLQRRAKDLGKTDKELCATMQSALEVANKAVYDHRMAAGAEMGTTLTAVLLLADKRAVVGNAGDSRVYLLRGDKLAGLTTDHTVAQDLVEAGKLSPEDALTHRGAHILTVTLGAEDELESDVAVHKLASSDRLLLCSDGLYGALGDDALATGLSSWPDRHKTMRRLLRGALNAGSTDNVTAMVVDVL